MNSNHFEVQTLNFQKITVRKYLKNNGQIFFENISGQTDKQQHLQLAHR
jgi:hypothetical protein